MEVGSEEASGGVRARAETQGVPTERRRPGFVFAPLRERFRGRGPGVLGFVLARALHWERRWEIEEGCPRVNRICGCLLTRLAR